jgi:hypothetical protein
MPSLEVRNPDDATPVRSVRKPIVIVLEPPVAAVGPELDPPDPELDPPDEPHAAACSSTAS